VIVRGQGDGADNMCAIIHDFISYNVHVAQNLAEPLTRRLSGRQLELIRRVAAEAESRGLAAYLVGGFPRDLVLGRRGTDLDLVLGGDAISLAVALAAKYGGRVTVHTRFGTAKWFVHASGSTPGSLSNPGVSDPEGCDVIDLTSARRETYQEPAALPRVRMGTIEDDLRRRDFTINTLAIRLDRAHFGEVRDDFGALEDLERGIVRVLHPRSFQDDPTRLLRAVRYEQRYGFRIAPDTLALIPEARGLIARLSGQRVRRELDLILDEAEVLAALRRLAQLNLLRQIHPTLPGDKTSLSIIPSATSAPPIEVQRGSLRNLRWLVWLIGLTATEIRSIETRLHFTAALTESLLAASKLNRGRRSLTRRRASQCTDQLGRLPILAVQAAYLASREPESTRILKEYIVNWRHVRPTVSGHDLKRLGIPPGPAYERILRGLRHAWLDGVIKDPEAERRQLESMVRRIPSAAGGSRRPIPGEAK
jgi:tRNA nucleotidyltransferase (CCA-adding enzyme)